MSLPLSYIIGSLKGSNRKFQEKIEVFPVRVPDRDTVVMPGLLGRLAGGRRGYLPRMAGNILDIGAREWLVDFLFIKDLKYSPLQDAYRTFRTFPCLWETFKRNTGRNILGRVSLCRVIDIRTFQAYNPDQSFITCHQVTSFVNLS
jgi:hypothetical protein